MTLNITAILDRTIVQVSDRRASLKGKPINDKTNKAVVISCDDGILAITFTGLAAYGSKRMDVWLCEYLVQEGAAELHCQQIPELLAKGAAAWFRRMIVTDKRHAFILAGFETVNAQALPFAALVTNMPQSWPPVVQSEVACAFKNIALRPVRGPWGDLYITGLTPAVTRNERRLLKNSLENAQSLDAVEKALVRTIQSAALSPDWSWGISAQCMSVALSAEGVAQSRFYTGDTQHEHLAPGFVWYESGRNQFVLDFEADQSFVRCTFGNARLQIDADPRALNKVTADARLRMKYMYSPAKHKHDYLEDSRIVGFDMG